MKIEVITHQSGDQLPMLVDDNGLPIPTPVKTALYRSGKKIIHDLLLKTINCWQLYKNGLQILFYIKILI